MERKSRSRKREVRMARLRKAMDLLWVFKKEDEGSTLVEVALTSSILFASIFGIIMISFALYTYDYIADAAHAGARYASVRGAYCVGFSDCGAGNTQITAFVQSLNYPGITAANMTVNTNWYWVVQTGGAATTISSCGTSPAGCNTPPYNSVEVEVVYNFPLNIPFWRSTTLTMSSKSQLPISQ
jgi:Flp pilus assembly protein TadG